MYRCEVCRSTCPKGAPRLTHALKRPGGQIARELAVCPACKKDLSCGCSLRDLQYIHQTAPRPAPFVLKK